jgi:hypothetical protein
MAKKWLRTAAVCARYGDVNPRSIQRAVDEGRLPPPEYPLENKIPFWDEEKLEKHDRGIAAERVTAEHKPVTETSAETTA